MLPPARGSNTVSAMSASSRLCSRGLKLSKPSVKTENAVSMGASTTIECRTDVSVACALMSLLHSLFDRRPVAGQRLVPEVVEVGAERAEPVRVQLIDAAGAVLAVHDQLRLLQHLQVLRDGGPADR